MFIKNRFVVVLPLLLLCIGFAAQLGAQGFHFPVREQSSGVLRATQLQAACVNNVYPTAPILYVSNDQRTVQLNATATFNANVQYKSNFTQVRFAVLHETDTLPVQSYVYRMVYKIEGSTLLQDSAVNFNVVDTLVIGYNGDSLTAYQDEQIKIYAGLYNAKVTVLGIYDATASAPTLVPSANLAKNFGIELLMRYQVYTKIASLSNMNLQTSSSYDANKGMLTVNWNYASAPYLGAHTPAQYDLEWTYVDDYGDSTSTPLSSSAVHYNFKYNATRVTTDSMSYKIPIVYPRGYVIFRVRMVRPDASQYRYPVYGNWSLSNVNGVVSALSNGTHYYRVATPHLGDSLNWNYAIQFAEGGKYKHVLSYYDGLLKNRQTITRFNSSPDKLLVTENIYDYEGRAAISTLPSVVKSPAFKFQDSVSISSQTNLPYQAIDFDQKPTTCPDNSVIPPFINQSRANYYYSTLNTDTMGAQKYVPQANGYPFVHTQLSPGFSDRVDRQGGAGPLLQINNGHDAANYYATTEQKNINSLFGLNAGIASYYNKTVSKDQNGQLSMAIKDFRGKLVATSLLGTVDTVSQALILNDEVPATKLVSEDKLAGALQLTVGNEKRWSGNHFMDADANLVKVKYEYSLAPFPVCTSPQFIGLTLSASYDYSLHDPCGQLELHRTGTLGTTGVVTSATANATVSQTDQLPLAKGNHTINKTLRVASSAIHAAVDSFFSYAATNPTSTCLKTENEFIKEAVDAITLPCAETPETECDLLKKAMEEELFPNHKYGKFTEDFSNAAGYTTVGITPSIFDINRGDVNASYRYTSACVLSALNNLSIMVYGNTYTNLGSLPADTFRYVYEHAAGVDQYQIAEALLPLHPEYCKLASCFVDTFMERLDAMSSAAEAVRYGYFSLNDLLQKDSYLRGKLQVAPFNLVHINDSLSTVYSGMMGIDTLACKMAFTSSDDTLASKEALSFFGNAIQNFSFPDTRTKDLYFEQLKTLYTANHNKWKSVLRSSGSNTCAPCSPGQFTGRIPVVLPAPLVPVYFDSSGAVSQASGSVLNSFSSAQQQQILSILSITAADTALIRIKKDSVIASDRRADTLLTSIAVDSLMARLANCFTSSLAQQKLHDTLLALFYRGAVHKGAFTPNQVRYAIVASGNSLSDLCHPYLYNYVKTEASPNTDARCKSDNYYESVTNFLNEATIKTALIAASNTTTVYSNPSYSNTNTFATAIHAQLNGVATQLLSNYDIDKQAYCLRFVRNTDTVAITIHSKARVQINNQTIPAFQNANSIAFTKVSCYFEDPTAEASGCVGLYMFAAQAERNDVVNGTTSTTPMTFTGWTQGKVPLQEASNGVLSACVPCTQFKTIFKSFKDTLQAYGGYNADHPFYYPSLYNFTNYQLQTAFTLDDYRDFLQSCALADSMIIPANGGWAKLSFPTPYVNGVNYANFAAFQSSFSTYTPQALIDYQSGSNEWVVIDPHSIPYAEHATLKAFVQSFGGSVNSTSGNTGIGYLLYPSSATLSSLLNTTGLSTSGSPQSITILVGGASFTGQRVALAANSNASPMVISQAIAKLYDNIYQTNTTAYWMPYALATVNADYYNPLKQAYLNYTYSAQLRATPRVLDTLEASMLSANLSALNGMVPSYYSTSTSLDSRSNLYYSNATQVYAGYGVLTTILNEVKNNLNNALLLPTNSSVLNATSNTGLLKLYRCQDGLYGYQYFKNGSLQLYTMYLRVPPVVQKSRHPYLVPVNVKLATGDTIVQRFVVNMIDPQYPSDTIAVQGSCDFDLAWSQVLHNVLLGTASARNTNMDGLSGTLGAENNCEQDRLNNAILAGKVKYINYVDSTKSALYAAFYDYIMQAADEHLWIDYTDKRFAYTLYNYDLAGNLIKTIPPMGVHPLDSASCVPIDAMRASNSFNIAQLPDHKKTSRYEYNSANQLVHEYTPDGGEKVMYYDAKGNLILSQNDKQRPKGLYTYCLYDAQNRIIETGEVNWMNCVYFADVPLYDANRNLTTPPNACACQNLNTSTWTYCMPSSQINFTDNAQFAQTIQSKPRTQVVITVYDKEFVNLATQPGMSRQSNLRNRVAASLYYPSYSAYTTSAYTHATHYSYDAAGNVNCLVQEFPELSSVHQQYKRIDYEFDLHSGKVNLLSYNRGYADQFYQRYSYDADNRIQSVETSHDGFIWKRDAGYTYYQHGPLARISLGAQRVQGVDYAYTLQGWLKAINGSALDTNLDMGGDGKAGSITPQDAYGTSLNYFNNDYAAIGASNWNNVPQPTKNLYNGNIARQTTALSVFGALTTAYTYDQQNRIRQAQYGSLNNQQVLDFNNWYASAYTYDLDGNLQSLVRHNSTGALLDSFAYVYTAPNDHNKLSDVWDRAANLSGGYDDIKQSAAPTVRYLYDELGQLSKDQTSGTDTIQWNLYGKVSMVENKTQKWTLRYGYDATGQRVSKAQQLSSDTGKLDKNTYYVRDAAGTILSVYELQKQWHSGKYVLQFLQNAYAAIDPAVATGSGFSNPSGYYVSALSTLGVLSDPSFKQSIQTHIGSSMPAQSAGQVLSADAGLRQQFLSNQPAALLRALQAYSQAQSKYPIADALAMYMQNEPSQVINKLLYALFRDGSQSDSVLLIRSNHLATLVPGLMQQFLRDYEIDTNTIARQQQLLKSVAQNSTYVNSYLLDTYNNEGITPLYAWLASTTSDSTQMLSDSLSDNIINTALQYYGDAVASQEADQQQIDKSQAGIYAFANWWQGASDYITTISPDLLGSISYDSDPELAVNNYLNSSNGDINKLHEAVAASSDGAPNLQRLASLLQVNLSPTNMTSPYVDVLKTQQMRLAEQPIYGSSRVGVASYWPGQYDAVWDYTTGTQDTLRLLGIKPWYSATIEGYKPAGSTEPYDNSSLGLASAAHLLGQKSYELSNHLGNVQATLSDKRYVQKQYYTASDSLRKGYAASVSSLYDYYPFGMLMKERCTSDTATQSVYMSQVVYSPQYTTVNNAMTGASITSLNNTTQTNYNGSINYFGQSASISKTLSNLQSGIPVSMKINLLYTNKPLYLTIQQGSTLLYSITMNSSGTYSFNFTPTQSTVQLSIAYSYFNTNANTLCFTLDSVNYTQQNGSTSSTQLVQISSKQSDKYRFGFNGQEKDNEIAGVGNHNTAEFWEYDTRVGRRWNRDPKPNVSNSNYATLNNNPIFYNDVLGDSVTTNSEGYSNTKMGVDGILNGSTNPIGYDEKNEKLTYNDNVDVSNYTPFQKDILNKYKEVINNKTNVKLKIVDVNDEVVKTTFETISLASIGSVGVTIPWGDEENIRRIDVYVARNPVSSNGEKEMPQYAGITNLHELAGHTFLNLTRPKLEVLDHNHLVNQLHKEIFKNFRINGRLFYRHSKAPEHKDKKDEKEEPSNYIGKPFGW
jgi:hypothetical protein